MSLTLNKEHYKKLINDDIEWLKKNTDECLEQQHIIAVLEDSVTTAYNKPFQSDRA